MDVNALNGPKMTEGQIQAYLARLGIFETVPPHLGGAGPDPAGPQDHGAL